MGRCLFPGMNAASEFIIIVDVEILGLFYFSLIYFIDFVVRCKLEVYSPKQEVLQQGLYIPEGFHSPSPQWLHRRLVGLE